MTSFLFYGYYYRYRQSRKSIRTLVENDDFVQAETTINNLIQEHDNYTTINGIPTGKNFEEFTSIDVRSLRHALTHLLKSDNNPIQKQATIDALNEIY